MGMLDDLHVTPGSHKTRWYITIGLPCMGGCALVLGIFSFGVGVGVLVQEDYHTLVAAVLFPIASGFLLVAGIFSILAGVLVIYFTRFTDASPPVVRKRSIWFIGILALAAILTLVALIPAFVYIGEVGNDMEDDLNTKIQAYGRTSKSLVDVDKIQSEGKCCGVYYYTDWRATIYGGHRYDKVPDSCCKDYEYGCGFKFKDETTINRRGCLEVVKSSIVYNLKWVGIGGIVVMFPKIGLVIFMCYVRHKHLNDS